MLFRSIGEANKPVRSYISQYCVTNALVTAEIGRGRGYSAEKKYFFCNEFFLTLFFTLGAAPVQSVLKNRYL